MNSKTGESTNECFFIDVDAREETTMDYELFFMF